MNPYCTFIAKERRVDIAQHHKYLHNIHTENDMTLWKNDEGNAAALLITNPGMIKASLCADVVDETKTPTSEIRIKAEFQKFISTYTGSNWSPEPVLFCRLRRPQTTGVSVPMLSGSLK